MLDVVKQWQDPHIRYIGHPVNIKGIVLFAYRLGQKGQRLGQRGILEFPSDPMKIYSEQIPNATG